MERLERCAARDGERNHNGDNGGDAEGDECTQLRCRREDQRDYTDREDGDEQTVAELLRRGIFLLLGCLVIVAVSHLLCGDNDRHQNDHPARILVAECRAAKERDAVDEPEQTRAEAFQILAVSEREHPEEDEVDPAEEIDVIECQHSIPSLAFLRFVVCRNLLLDAPIKEMEADRRKEERDHGGRDAVECHRDEIHLVAVFLKHPLDEEQPARRDKDILREEIARVLRRCRLSTDLVEDLGRCLASLECCRLAHRRDQRADERRMPAERDAERDRDLAHEHIEHKDTPRRCRRDLRDEILRTFAQSEPLREPDDGQHEDKERHIAVLDECFADDRDDLLQGHPCGKSRDKAGDDDDKQSVKPQCEPHHHDEDTG